MIARYAARPRHFPRFSWCPLQTEWILQRACPIQSILERVVRIDPPWCHSSIRFPAEGGEFAPQQRGVVPVSECSRYHLVEGQPDLEQDQRDDVVLDAQAALVVQQIEHGRDSARE